MHITVIGGSGFIGTRLCQMLAANPNCDFLIYDKVLSPVFPEKCVIGDVRDLPSLRERIPSGTRIVNLAAEHRDDVKPRSLYDEVNVGGARNIVRVASEKSIDHIVFASSVAVYGSAPARTGETGELRPFNEYGRTKALAEDVFRSWRDENSNDRSLIIVRPTVVFGEKNRGNVYNLLRQIHSGIFLMVGSGLNRKSMAYVGNVAAFFEHSVIAMSGNRTFNYVDGPDFCMNELVRIASETMGRNHRANARIPYRLALLFGHLADAFATVLNKRFPISAVRVEKFCMESTFTSGASEAGFLAPTPLFEALSSTIAYEFLETHDRSTVFYSE